MKKVLFLLATAALMTSCGSGELENLYSEYQKVEENKEKKDPNFLIFKDRTQTGKENGK